MCSNMHIIKIISVIVYSARMFDKPVAVSCSNGFMLMAVKVFLSMIFNSRVVPLKDVVRTAYMAEKYNLLLTFNITYLEFCQTC